MMSKIACRIFLAVSLFCGLGLRAQDSGNQTGTNAPDNTKTNQRDRDASEATADRQSESSSDRELTRQIRRALVQDKSLSSAAHNIKIVTQDGNVTLKGPVKSEEEKTAIENKAAQVAGDPGKVHDQLEVTGK